MEENTSYGLPIILNSLTGLGGAWGVLIVARSKGRKENGANGEQKKNPNVTTIG